MYPSFDSDRKESQGGQEDEADNCCAKLVAGLLNSCSLNRLYFWVLLLVRNRFTSLLDNIDSLIRQIHARHEILKMLGATHLVKNSGHQSRCRVGRFDNITHCRDRFKKHRL